MGGGSRDCSVDKVLRLIPGAHVKAEAEKWLHKIVPWPSYVCMHASQKNQ